MGAHPALDAIAGTVEVRNELLAAYKRQLVKDVRGAIRDGLPQRLWRTVFYRCIETLRGASKDGRWLPVFHAFLAAATAFYKAVIQEISSRYRINLACADCWVGSPQQPSRRTHFALMACQYAYIALGDVARYCHTARVSGSSMEDSEQYYKVRWWP